MWGGVIGWRQSTQFHWCTPCAIGVAAPDVELFDWLVGGAEWGWLRIERDWLRRGCSSVVGWSIPAPDSS